MFYRLLKEKANINNLTSIKLLSLVSQLVSYYFKILLTKNQVKSSTISMNLLELSRGTQV